MSIVERVERALREREPTVASPRVRRSGEKRNRLYHGPIAVDEEDMPLLLNHKWRRSSNGYVIRSAGEGARRTTLSLHRVILGAAAGQVVDHRDHDTLNNRRENLRLCTVAENTAHSVRPRNGAGYRGVAKSRQRFQAAITLSNRTLYLGHFPDAESAARAYDAAAAKAFGQFAKLNFPTSAVAP